MIGSTFLFFVTHSSQSLWRDLTGKKCAISTWRHISQIIISNDKKKRYRRSLIRLRIVISGSRCRLTCSKMNSTRRNKNTRNSLHTHSASARWYAAVADARTTISSARMLLTRSIDYPQKAPKRGIIFAHFRRFFYH